MDIQFDNRTFIHLFWAVPVLLAVFAYGFHRKRAALHVFATGNLISQLVPDAGFSRQKFKAAMLLAAVALLIFALTGPRWGVHYEEVHRRGIDIVFCLDVSRSMLAEDVTPNRLERAKQYIKDVVAQLGGDRVGLVTFAGDAVLQCPLTIDYGTFRMILDQVGIRSARRGGTLIGDAVRLAADSFADPLKKYKAVILITDGEDHESYPVEAAANAFAEKGIRVYTIGIGDLNEGSRIPITRNGQRVYLTHEGQEVWSKLDVATLRQMAENGGGRFIPAGTRQVDMGQVYEQSIATADLREFESTHVRRYDVQYQWFAGLALILLTAEALMADRRRSATELAERLVA